MKIGIYGLGRFGTFWGQQLARLGQVHGYSRTKKDNLPPSIRQVEFAELFNADVIVMCVAISSMTDAVTSMREYLKPGTLVMDTCSVKVRPVEDMVTGLPSDMKVIGTHPMFGPDSGKRGVRDLPMVFSPVRCDEETVSLWKRLFTEELGVRLFEMSPEEHDREAAVTQGITHFIGRVLKEMDLKKSNIGTLGYTKLLEIIEQTCNDPYQLFVDLQRYNPYTNEMRSRLLAAMKHQAEAVGNNKLDTA